MMSGTASLLAATLAMVIAAGRIDAQSCSKDYTKEEMEGKVGSFTAMRTTGFSLLGLGGAALAGGIVLMSTAEWESYSTGTSTGIRTQDSKGGAGLIMLVVSIPVSAAGAVLGIVGTRKAEECKRCVQVTALDVRVDRHRCGLALKCAF